MDREAKKALQSEARYDWDAHATTRNRNAAQIDTIPGPQYPATGTARISAILAASGPARRPPRPAGPSRGLAARAARNGPSR